MFKLNGVVHIESKDLHLDDPFLKSLADLCDVSIPLTEWEAAQDKEELVKDHIKKEIKKYKSDSISYSWTVSPERMGQ
jgi:hypothetical protein